MIFDFKNKGRLRNLVKELETLRYIDITDIQEFLWYEDDGTVGAQKPTDKNPKTIALGWRWKGYDVYNWLETTIEIPKNTERKRVVALFDFGVPKGSGNNSHFESLLYVNDKIYQAVDGNHREVFFDNIQGKTHLRFRVWSGLNGGGKPKEMEMHLKTAKLAYLDKDTDNFYFFARTILDTHSQMDNSNPEKEWLLNQLVEAFKHVDYTNVQSDVFYESITCALQYLEKTVRGQAKQNVFISLVGHTHIDVAWLWRLRHTREKAARSFSSVNRLMQTHEQYIFLQSQAQLYDYIKYDYPEIYTMIKQRIQEGRWEPSGSMWVECDCNLSSGESIVRQILVGKNFFKTEFNYDNDFLWLPDVFGYSWAMPQILKKAGVNSFITSKISWNDTNQLPYDTFMWRGIDGTEIVTQFITTADKDDKGNLDSSYTYNGDTQPYVIQGTWDNYKNKDLNRDLFISYGYGDGGGGPNRDMLKTIEQLNKMPSIPHVRIESVSKTLKRIHKNIKENKLNGHLPIWDGELYLEFHRGTYTSQGYVKKMNRYLEFMLRDTEILSVFANIYDQSTLLEAWKIVLRNQFHDILPGSSIHEVYEDCKIEYAEAEQKLKNLQKKAFNTVLSKKKGTYTVFNSASFLRNSYIVLPSEAPHVEYFDKSGEKLPSALFEGRQIVKVCALKPTALYSFYASDVPLAENTQKLLQTAQKIETPFYVLEWNTFGQIIRLYDKNNKREVFAKNQKGNVLQIFEDKPRCFDAWELESTIDGKKEEITNLVNMTTYHNILGYEIQCSWKYNKSTINQFIFVYNDSPRIDFKTTVDWQETQKILKTAFTVDIRSTQARFDIQYGNILRSITRNTSWEAAKYEVCAHKWVDFSETDYGLALLNDCKYGYDIKDNTMRLSLLKSATDPDYDADKGSHEFTYSLLPHAGNFVDARVEQYAFDLNNPLIPYEGSADNYNSLVTFTNPHVFLDCVKRAENSTDIVIRFHEYCGTRGKTKVVWDNFFIEKKLQWCEANLMEEPLTKWKTSDITVAVTPYEIKTILIKGE